MVSKRIERLAKAAEEAKAKLLAAKRKEASAESQRQRKQMDTMKFVLGGYILANYKNLPTAEAMAKLSAIKNKLPDGERRKTFDAAMMLYEVEHAAEAKQRAEAKAKAQPETATQK